MIYPSKASKEIGKRKNKLDPIRDNLQILVDRANLMVSKLQENGLGDSPAILEAQRTMSSSANELFSVQDKHRYRELRREAARLDSFLSQAESLVSVTLAAEKSIDAVAKHNLSFWNQSENLERTGFRFGNVDEERVKFALEIFRRVKDDPENAIAFESGSERFNSDTIFNLIFDSIEGYNPNMSEDSRDVMMAYTIAEAKRSIEEHMIYEAGFLSGSPYVNKEVDIIDNLKKAKSADEFLAENEWATRYKR